MTYIFVCIMPKQVVLYVDIGAGRKVGGGFGFWEELEIKDWGLKQ